MPAANLLFVSVLPLWSGGADRWGGPAFARTLDGYCDAGHQVYLITIAPESEAHARPNLHVIVTGAWLSRLPNRFVVTVLKSLIGLPLAAMSAWWRLRRRVRLDLVYGYEVDGIFAAWLIARLARRPLVTRFQGTVLAPILLERSTWRSRIAHLLHVLAFKVPADLAIMTDDGTRGAEVMRQLNPSLFPRTKVWRNGVDPAPAAVANRNSVRARFGLDDASTVLLTVSRLVQWKRVDRAIAAMPLIASRLPGVALVIVGDGPARPALETLARELGVESCVHFAGHVPHDRVFDFHRDADIFLSLYDLSNVGNPLLEAMRSGRPVVTLRNGDTGAVIADDVNGVLLEDATPATVGDAVVALALDRPRRARLGEAARRWTEQALWTWRERIDAELAAVLPLVGIKPGHVAAAGKATSP